MKKSKHTSVNISNDIRLHKLYKAIKSPQSSSNNQYITQLNTTPVSSIDNLLCKIQSQFQKTRQTENDNNNNNNNNQAEDSWPLHRLLEIFNTILLCMQHRSQQDDLLRLLSFKANVRMVLQYLVYDEENLDEKNNEIDASFFANKMKAAKCWCTLLEHLAKLFKQDLSKGTGKAILNDIKLKHSHIHALKWATDVTQKDMSPFIQHSAKDKYIILARNYCLRGLNAHISSFGYDLIEHHVYQRLLLHPLTFYFGNNYEHFYSMDSSTYSSSNQHQQQDNDDEKNLLSFCNTASQLLDNLIKSEKDIGIQTENKNSWGQYIKLSSTNSLSLIKVWVGSLFMLIKNGNITSSSIKEVSQIFYYLTVIVSKMSTDSGVFNYLVPNFDQQLNNSTLLAFKRLWTWHRVLPLLLSQFIYRLQMDPQQDDDQKADDDDDKKKKKKANMLISPYSTPLLIRLLVYLCNIFWKCQRYITNNTNSLQVKENDMNNIHNSQNVSEMITGYITNFLLAYTAHPIPIEMIVVMACNNNDDNHISLLPMTLTADVVIRGYYGLTSSSIENHHSLLTPLLETLIQYTPLIRKSWRLNIGPKLAWSMKSLLSLLHADNKLDELPLLPRIEKLIVYLLHDDNAIDQLADCTTGLGKYIWDPTIHQARIGLSAATSILNNINSSSSDNTQALEKGKRALMALEKTSRHSRACERLADTDILNLVDNILLSSLSSSSSTSLSDHEEKETCSFTADQTQILVRAWTVYALFTSLLASLAGRTSLLRSKLRQENRLIPSIMDLLWYSHQFECKVFLKQASTPLSMACRYVVNGCLQVINAYRYDQQAIQEWMLWQHDTENNISLIRILLCIIIPWRNENRNHHHTHIGQWWTLFDNQMCMASMILENLSQYAKCGEQLIEMNDHALRDICQWMVSITNVTNNGFTLENNSDHNNNTNGITKDQMDDKLQYEFGMNDDQRYFYCDNNNDTETTHSAEDETIITNNLLEENIEENINTAISSMVSLKSENDKSINKKQPVTLKKHCLLPLSRCLTKIISHRSNLKSLIMYDGFTQIFSSFLSDIHKDINSTWITVTQQLCKSLYLRIDDLERLIQFYDQNDQEIKRRHELTAVAMIYATCWHQGYWQSKLGLLDYDTTKESIVYSTDPFGIVCHMLTMRFDDNMTNNDDYDHHNNKNMDIDDDNNYTSIITSNENDNKSSIGIQPGSYQQRRNAAAQALTMLIVPFQTTWKKKLNDSISAHQLKLNQTLLSKQDDDGNDRTNIQAASPSITTSLNKNEYILLRTDDSIEPIKVKYTDLTWLSPAFTAMLSSHYAETDYIHLRDIPMSSLKHYIYVSQQLYLHHHHQQQQQRQQQQRQQQQQQAILQGWQWDDIIVLTQVADRYGGLAIQLLCEIWMLEQIKNQQDGYLSGCLNAYLQLKNKYQHDDGGGLLCTTWPYRIVLCQCIKAMISDLLGLINTDSFQQFINSDNYNIENIEDFCNAIYVFFHDPLA